MFFKKKNSAELAAELKELKRKRLKETGRAKLNKMIAEEKAKIRESKGQSGFGKVMGGFKKTLDRVEVRSPEERRSVEKRVKNYRIF